MARYKLLELSYINDRLCQEGEEVVVDDSVTPGPHMVPLDKAAKTAAKKAGIESNAPVGDQVDEITATAPTENPVE